MARLHLLAEFFATMTGRGVEIANEAGDSDRMVFTQNECAASRSDYATADNDALFLLLSSLIAATPGCSHMESAHLRRETSQIAVERPENNGAVNILPCTMTFSDGQTYTLSGGDRAVVSVQSGTLWVVASSPDPYALADPNSPAWHSRRKNCM